MIRIISLGIIFLFAFSNFSHATEKPTQLLMKLKEPISKLDLCSFILEISLDNYFKKLNSKNQLDFLPSGFNVYVNGDKIFIHAIAFPDDKTIKAGNIQKLMAIGYNEIRKAIAINEGQQYPTGDSPTWLTKRFFPNYWIKLDENWRDLQKSIYDLIYLNYEVIFFSDDGNLNKIRSHNKITETEIKIIK
jgi:hypothetical protein